MNQNKKAKDISEDIVDLNNLLNDLENETGFKHGRIQVFIDGEGTYTIEIDGHLYSIYITVEEADFTLRVLFDGIRLANTAKLEGDNASRN